MNNIIFAICIGVGATLTFDLWLLFLKYVFTVAPSNTCLMGRWILYMPEGVFRHSNINSTPKKNAECLVGWVAHYVTGIIFAIAFIGLVGNHWLQHPKLIPALLFGIVTVLLPFFIMQPAFGFGIAASKAPNPTHARLRTLLNHTAFGVGLYLFGLLTNFVVINL